jgi:hypothetical protein
MTEAAEPEQAEVINDADEMLNVISATGGNIVRQAAEVIRSRGLSPRPPRVQRPGSKPQERYLRWSKGREAAACLLTPSRVVFGRTDDQAKLSDLPFTTPRQKNTVILLSAPDALKHIDEALATIGD